MVNGYEFAGRLAPVLTVSVDVEFVWYEGADHAFFNDSRPEVFKPEAARQAWDRTVSFLRKHLAVTPAPV